MIADWDHIDSGWKTQFWMKQRLVSNDALRHSLDVYNIMLAWRKPRKVCHMDLFDLVKAAHEERPIVRVLAGSVGLRLRKLRKPRRYAGGAYGKRIKRLRG